MSKKLLGLAVLAVMGCLLSVGSAQAGPAGVCGSANGVKTITAPTKNLCKVGYASPVYVNGNVWRKRPCPAAALQGLAKAVGAAHRRTAASAADALRPCGRCGES